MYKDPLHVPYKDLEIKYKDRSLILNKSLIDSQNCWCNVSNIKDLHLLKMQIMDFMDTCEDNKWLRNLGETLRRLEFALQRLWGFPEDKNYHRWWYHSKCSCPKMDNDDAYPTGYSYISGDCPLHGGVA